MILLYIIHNIITELTQKEWNNYTIRLNYVNLCKKYNTYREEQENRDTLTWGTIKRTRQITMLRKNAWLHLTHQHTFTFFIRRARRSVCLPSLSYSETCYRRKYWIEIAHKNLTLPNVPESKVKTRRYRRWKFCDRSYSEKAPRTVTSSSAFCETSCSFFYTLSWTSANNG